MVTLPNGSQFSNSSYVATLQLSNQLQTQIGSQPSGTTSLSHGDSWAGELAALVIYNRVLTPLERAKVTEALRQVYTIPGPASLAFFAVGAIGLVAER